MATGKSHEKNALGTLRRLKDDSETIFFYAALAYYLISGIWNKGMSDILPDEVNEFFTRICYDAQYLRPIALIVIVVLFGKSVYSCSKRTAESNKRIIGLMTGMHDKYIHLMRNHIVELETLGETILQLNLAEKEDRKTYEKYFDREHLTLENNLTNCVNNIQNVLDEMMGFKTGDPEAICVCIKMVGIGENSKAAEKRTLITIARSSNTKKYRKRPLQKDIIGDNSDFLELSRGYKNMYYGTNLRQKHEKGVYLNSSRGFEYESTIVVPIRYRVVKTSHKIDDNRKSVRVILDAKSDIAGFLCIDSTKIIPEWEKSEKVRDIVNVLSPYADSLYIYLHSFFKVFDLGEVS